MQRAYRINIHGGSAYEEFLDSWCLSGVPSGSWGVLKAVPGLNVECAEMKSLVVLALILAAAVAIAPTAAAVVTVADVEVDRITWNGYDSEYGEVCMELWLDGSVAYVNVLADLDGSGAFADYAVGVETQTEWVCRNVPATLAIGTHTECWTFPLIDPAVAVGSAVDMEVHVSPTPMATQPYGGASHPGEIVGLGYRFISGGGIEESMVGVMPDPAVGGFNDVFLSETSASSVEWEYTNKDMPDNDQVCEECAPTATANSLRWLAKENDFEDKIPATDRALIDSLKKKRYMDTKCPGGTTMANIVKGKREFISRKGLPLVVEFQCGVAIEGQPAQKPTVAFLKEQMSKKQDIELIFVHLPLGNGGHAVTLVRLKKKADGTVEATVNDPDDGKKVGKPIRLREIAAGTWAGYLTGDGYGKANILAMAVAESPKPTAVESRSWGRIKALYR